MTTTRAAGLAPVPPVPPHAETPLASPLARRSAARLASRMHSASESDRRGRRSALASFASTVAAIAGGVTLLAASPKATAQDYTYLLLVDYGPGETSVHPGNPSATVRVWATLKETDWAWASGNLDLHADEPGWTAFELVLGQEGVFARTRGTLSTDMTTIEGIRTSQFNDHFEETAKTDHPILIWQGTWSNLSSNYTHRIVDLTTSNTTFYRVYLTDSTIASDKLAGFTPGAATIAITPSPAGGAFVVSSVAFSLCRRRRV